MFSKGLGDKAWSQHWYWKSEAYKVASPLTEGFRLLEACALKKIIGLEFLILFLTLLLREQLCNPLLSPCAASPWARKQGKLVSSGNLLLSQ